MNYQAFSPFVVVSLRNYSSSRRNFSAKESLVLLSSCLTDRVLQNQLFFESVLNLGKLCEVENFIRALLRLI